MIIGISIGNGFDNYGLLYETITSNEKCTEICGMPHALLKRLSKEANLPLQLFTIDWGNIEGAANVKLNRFQKPYNADAPAEAAQRVVNYSDQIVEFGGGDYNIRKYGSSKILNKAEAEQNLQKRYKF